MNFITKILLTALTLFLLAEYFPGIEIDKVSTAIVAALVFGLLNFLLKPILVILTLPINILTLGLFTLVINAFLLWLVGEVVPGFSINNFISAFFGAIILSLVSYLANRKE